MSKGKNVGVFVVVTLDELARPVLVTTVHTCGCYGAIVPTDYLRPDALPEHWTGQPLDVYGERLRPGWTLHPFSAPECWCI